MRKTLIQTSLVFRQTSLQCNFTFAVAKTSLHIHCALAPGIIAFYLFNCIRLSISALSSV